jgi:pilus assembly protein Flp/PilA
MKDNAMIGFAKKILVDCVRDEKGASAVEYAILAAIVGGGLVVAAQGLSTGIGTAFTTITGSITGAAGGSSSGG